MKSAIRFLLIIAAAAVFGFSFAACDNGTTSSDPDTGSTIQ